jgi:hypothetical protein
MRLLVLANETCASLAVIDAVRRKVTGADGAAQVIVVAPALSQSRMSYWFSSDVRAARTEAADRLDQSLDALRAAGISASGDLGDADPLQALDDAIRIHSPSDVLIATHTPERSQWLERRLVDRARLTTDLPIEHVVVDLEYEREHNGFAPAHAEALH